MSWQPVSYWHQWHRLHSVRWNALTVACGGALAAYGTALNISPRITSGIPHWILTVLVAGTMIGPILSSIGAVIKQDLPPAVPKPPASNDFHQRQPPC